VEGLENARGALIGLLRGKNFGNFWCDPRLPPHDPALIAASEQLVASQQLAFFAPTASLTPE